MEVPRAGSFDPATNSPKYLPDQLSLLLHTHLSIFTSTTLKQSSCLLTWWSFLCNVLLLLLLMLSLAQPFLLWLVVFSVGLHFINLSKLGQSLFERLSYTMSTLVDSVLHPFCAFIVANSFLKTFLVLNETACLIKKKVLEPTAETSHFIIFIHI